MKAEIVKNQLIQARLEYEQKRVEILSALADNYLFEYNKAADEIHFMKPIRLHNRMIHQMTDCTKNRSLVPYIYPDDLERVIQLLSSEDGGTIDFRCLTKNGYCWFRGTMLKVMSMDPNSNCYLGSVTNINREKNTSELLGKIRSIDSLTKLYNMEFMQFTIDNLLQYGVKERKYSLIIMDLLNFRSINESLGYMFGDSVLIHAASALRNHFYPNEFIARVGSDKFMIFTEEPKSREELFMTLDKVNRELSGIYMGDVREMISAVFGIADYPQDGANFEQLFQHADTACYVAKRKGYGNMMFYENCRLHLKEEEQPYYGEYRIPQRESLSYNCFDRDITTFSVEVLQKMRNADQAIVVLLNHLSDVLEVDQVKLYEAGDDHNSLIEKYTSGNRYHIVEQSMSVYDESGLLQYESLYQNGFLGISSTKNMKLMPLKQMFYEQGVHAVLQCAIYEDGIFRGCISLEDLSGERVWTEYEYSALYTVATIFSTYLFQLRDYEDMKMSLINLKDYDQLTKLLSFSRFTKEAERKLERDGGKFRYAMVSTDFIHFQYVNDKCGYDVGDQLLYEYARTLELMEQSILIARESADRFLMLIQFDSLEKLKEQITEMNEEFVERQQKRLLGWKLGIVAGICEVHNALEISDAMEKAGTARKSMKDVYVTNTSIYKEEMHLKVKKQLEIISIQEQALQNHEFEVYLQPKVELQNNQLVGAEALVRWKRRDGTILYPDEFIPIFEKNGFIVSIDFFVYEKVCQMVARWRDELNMEIPVSVNVSRVHLRDKNFVNDIEQLVKQYHIPAHLIELELTESMVLNHVEEAVNAMEQLQKKGFLVSIDDFGSGYSSLNLLKDLKTDILKLDKEFFRQGDLRRQDKIIVSNIINMAKQLDMKVLSEGVETVTQSEFLRESSCDMAQGYLYAKPMPVQEFENLLLKYSKNQ